MNNIQKEFKKKITYAIAEGIRTRTQLKTIGDFDNACLLMFNNTKFVELERFYQNDKKACLV